MLKNTGFVFVFNLIPDSFDLLIVNCFFFIDHSAFAAKTVFVTGGSRGIGKAIALKMAKDGCNVIIAAKTTDPHPKLEGTIFTAAKESEYFFWLFKDEYYLYI